MAGKNRNQGMSPAGKIAVLLALFGIPALFFMSSWGLSKVFQTAPIFILALVVIFATAYTAYTAKLLFDFYDVDAPILRFVPCVCEIALTDLKFHIPCYICYVLFIIFAGLAQVSYGLLKSFGDMIALNAGFYLYLLALLMLVVVQIIKGIGLMRTVKDVSNEWYKQTRVEVGAITKFSFLCFIPFVRVIAFYSLSKPLSTMVSFMGVSVDDADTGDSFEEEEE